MCVMNGFVAVDPEDIYWSRDVSACMPEMRDLFPHLKACRPQATSLGRRFNFYASIHTPWLYYKRHATDGEFSVTEKLWGLVP